MIGIAAGLSMSGLILGALSGSIWYMLGFFAAGMLVIGIDEAIKSCRNKIAADYKLSQYPPYGY